MEDVLLLHDIARPHTSLRTREGIINVGWTVLPHSAASPDLAPSDYELFVPVKDALSGRHFADDNETKRSFLMRSEVEAGNFGILQHWYTASYSTLAKVC
jgi:hypothetical protein